MVSELVTAIHCVDAAAAAARVHAREERSEAWQLMAVRISGLCAQLVTVAANAGHSGLLAPAERQAGSLAVELARASRLLSELPPPAGARPRAWTRLVLDVQTVAREAIASPVTAALRGGL